ncbi:UDP-N-acetylmuramate dehydrogenase [Rickettsiales bacterium LUAb2]
MDTTYSQQLNEVLQKCRGKVYQNYNISKLTFFKAGGTTDYLFIPSDIKDLQFFLKNKPENTKVLVLGFGSNMLIRDGGFKGVIIKLNNFNHFKKINNSIYVESNVGDKTIATFAKDNNLTGAEFLYTIPGCVGGAFGMNAGAYGKEFKDIFVEGSAITLAGELITLTADDINFSYRHTELKNKAEVILLSVVLSLTEGNNAEIALTMQEMEQQRLKSQPQANIRTGGSTFTNPVGAKAWELIKAIGGDKLAVNGAKVSSKHCNFLENTGSATAKDIEDLGEFIKSEVKAKFNIDLHWEIKIIGEEIAK